MKTAIVYYSYEGHSAFAAAELAKLLDGADVFPIKIEDDKKRKGFFKFFWGGKMVFSKRRPELKEFSGGAFDISKYDLIILGAPVWAGHPAPPLLSFIDKIQGKSGGAGGAGGSTGVANALAGKKFAIFLCHLGGKGNAAEKVKAELDGSGASFVSEIDFINPTSENFDGEKLKKWAESLNA